MIKKYGGKLEVNFDTSSLAKVSDGYTPGHLKTAVTTVWDI